MSPRPMRRYVAPALVCARCLMRIHGEVRMVDGNLYHPVCAVPSVRSRLGLDQPETAP